MGSNSASTSSKPSDETDTGVRAASQADSAATDPSEALADRPSLKCLQDLVTDLNTATDVILRSGRRRYSHVTALVACWPDKLSDRLHIRQSAKELCRVLKNQYKFDVNDKPYEMEEAWPHAMFNAELLKCLTKPAPGFIPAQRPEDPTKLFLLYYGGHAVEKDGKMVWRPSENAEEQTEIVWTSLLDLFVGFDGDILFLFDCCYAGDMIDYGRVFKRRCEVFCASHKSKKASGELKHSFTRALVRELATEAEIRGICEIKRVRSLLNLKAKKDAYDLKVDPFWDRFTRWDDTPICIAPLGNGSEDPRPNGSPGIVQELKALSDARVIFKATFEPDARLILQEWKEFVHWRPRNLKDIQWYALRETHFQSLFKTNSSSAIISIPMMLWDSMPKRVAYEFICVVRSTDMLGNLPRRNQAACPVEHQTIAASHVAVPGSSGPVVEPANAESALRISEKHDSPPSKVQDGLSSILPSWVASKRTKPPRPKGPPSPTLSGVPRLLTGLVPYPHVPADLGGDPNINVLRHISKKGPTWEQVVSKLGGQNIYAV